jgi:hypothetical protein
MVREPSGGWKAINLTAQTEGDLSSTNLLPVLAGRH